MLAVAILFWALLVALAWTHVVYPLVAALLVRVRPRPVACDDAYLPGVAVVVAAYDEEA